jgi:hypothetical protein
VRATAHRVPFKVATGTVPDALRVRMCFPTTHSGVNADRLCVRVLGNAVACR